MSFPVRWKKASGERQVLRQNGPACAGRLLTALQPQKAASSEPLHHLGAHVSASSWKAGDSGCPGCPLNASISAGCSCSTGSAGKMCSCACPLAEDIHQHPVAQQDTSTRAGGCHTGWPILSPSLLSSYPAPSRADCQDFSSSGLGNATSWQKGAAASSQQLVHEQSSRRRAGHTSCPLPASRCLPPNPAALAEQ